MCSDRTRGKAEHDNAVADAAEAPAGKTVFGSA